MFTRVRKPPPRQTIANASELADVSGILYSAVGDSTFMTIRNPGCRVRLMFLSSPYGYVTYKPGETFVPTNGIIKYPLVRLPAGTVVELEQE